MLKGTKRQRTLKVRKIMRKNEDELFLQINLQNCSVSFNNKCCAIIIEKGQHAVCKMAQLERMCIGKLTKKSLKLELVKLSASEK